MKVISTHCRWYKVSWGNSGFLIKSLSFLKYFLFVLILSGMGEEIKFTHYSWKQNMKFSMPKFKIHYLMVWKIKAGIKRQGYYKNCFLMFKQDNIICWSTLRNQSSPYLVPWLEICEEPYQDVYQDLGIVHIQQGGGASLTVHVNHKLQLGLYRISLVVEHLHRVLWNQYKSISINANQYRSIPINTN